VLGWSYGGITAQFMATQYSSVKKMVIWGTIAYIGPEDAKIYRSERLMPLIIF